jgi:adenylylsulfate kinase-like enzyme
VLRMASGAVLWFTGRSGAGKSTVVRSLVPLLEARRRTVSVYDVVPVLAKTAGERSSEGKLLRKAFVAAEVARHGGLAICVTVSAGSGVRSKARDIVADIVDDERFIEIYAQVPAEVASARKGARAKKPPLMKRLRHGVRALRRGGAETNYDPPAHPDITLDTHKTSPEESARQIIVLLERKSILDSQ